MEVSEEVPEEEIPSSPSPEGVARRSLLIDSPVMVARYHNDQYHPWSDDADPGWDNPVIFTREYQGQWYLAMNPTTQMATLQCWVGLCADF